MKNIIKLTLLLIVSVLILTGCTTKQTKYDMGVEAMNNGDWSTAIECFDDLDYEDSSTLLKECIREKGMHEKSDYDFLETMETALMKRYERSLKTDDIKSCVNIELSAVSGFKDKSFYDENLQKLANDYIDALNLEKQSLSAKKGNQQLMLYEGKSKRFEILKKLTDDYGLLKDNNDYIVNYYNETEYQLNYYNALVEVENDLNKQFKKIKSSDYVNDYTQRVQIKNNTKYDYDMYVHFTYYDSKGTILETREEYYEGIKSGKKYNLDFYYPEKARQWEYYTEEYIEMQ